MRIKPATNAAVRSGPIPYMTHPADYILSFRKSTTQGS
jgi:hypothetical protein